MIVPMGEKLKKDTKQAFEGTVREVITRDAEITLKQSAKGHEVHTDSDPLTTCLALRAGAAAVFKAMLNEEDEKDRAGIKDGMVALFGAFIDWAKARAKEREEEQ